MATKITNTHSTYIPEAMRLREFARDLAGVNRIAAGHISGGVAPGRCRATVFQDGGCVLLKVRGTSALQEVRLYTDPAQAGRIVASLQGKIDELGWTPIEKKAGKKPRGKRAKADIALNIRGRGAERRVSKPDFALLWSDNAAPETLGSLLALKLKP